MSKPQKKVDYFKIQDLRLNKIFWAIACASLTTMGASLVLSFFLPINHIVNVILFVLLILLFIAFVTVYLYNYTVNKAASLNQQETLKIESPLTESAKSHEQQIIDLLKSIAKPSAGKQQLNRAPTAQFLRALTELGFLDANVSGPNLLAWVENVTGYKDKDDDSGHFFAAYNKPTKEDSKVRKYMDQIQQIVVQ